VGSTAEDIAHQLDRFARAAICLGPFQLLFTHMLGGKRPPGKVIAKQGDTLFALRPRAYLDGGRSPLFLGNPAMSLIRTGGVRYLRCSLWTCGNAGQPTACTEIRALSASERQTFLTNNYGVRILCAARSGKWDTGVR